MRPGRYRSSVAVLEHITQIIRRDGHESQVCKHNHEVEVAAQLVELFPQILLWCVLPQESINVT